MRPSAPDVRSSTSHYWLSALSRRVAGAVGTLLRRNVANFTDFLRGPWITLAGGADDVTNPMGQNTAVYSSIRAIAQTIMGFPMVLYRAEDPDRIVTAGPAFDLLSQPQRGLTSGQFQEQWAGHLVHGGEAHILIEGRLDAVPTALSIVGRAEMTPKLTTDHRLLWWDYRRGSQAEQVLPEEDAYTRLLNPTDPIRGLGPLEAAGLAIKQDYHASLFNVAALQNGAHPGGLLVFPGDVSPEQAKEHTRALEARHQGAARANRVLVIGGGVDYKATAFKATDVELIPGRKFSREEIFNAFGVPSVIVAIYESAHYDVADASIRIYLLFTVDPLVQSYQNVMNLLVLPRIEPGVRLRLDTSQHPVLQELMWARFDTLAKALKTGVPYNEAKRILNLPLGDQPWGDTSLLESGLSTAEDVIAGLGAPPETDATEEEEEAAVSRQPSAVSRDHRRGAGATRGQAELGSPPEAEFASRVSAEQRAEERQVRAQMPGIRQRYRSFFLRQEREIVAKLRRAERNKATGDQVTTRAGLDSERPAPLRPPLLPCSLVTGALPWERAADDEAAKQARRALLRITTEQGRLRKLAREYLTKAVKETLIAELKRLGWEAERTASVTKKLMGDRWIQGLIRAKESKVAAIEITTRRRLVKTLTEGIGKGETVTDLATRVHAVLGGDRSRALTIARTESGQAVSVARFAAASAAGAQVKAWKTGSNPRASHIVAGQRYKLPAGAIPMDEAFEVGNDRLMYPRDPNGSAGEIINCNCILFTFRKAKEGARFELVNVLGLAGLEKTA